ncbi:MAG: hypothetical protein AVDCRST_MAG59-4980 [uncultured Thermomicrobiales bacterium]|uniref:Enoyl reductase (ER) domain-containing protein n=1 Tax=uncultured Thermomicrobiales bacterium TaxID=1645740 RepID=A0A6J4VMT0_9BACT|nr:MAG: hypothetical protein AVDCRST_MAG59-4980 [uncultured Thermomicrobiales bacterium]
MTAWQALVDAADLRPGQTVLVHAAAGGVGHPAVHIAKLRGAHAIATAGRDNLDFVRGLGAETAIDHRARPFEDEVAEADVVLDPVGGDVYRRSFDVLRPGGVLVSTAEVPDEAAAKGHGVRARWIENGPNGALLREIVGQVERGRLRPTVHEVLPLAEAGRAHEISQAGHVHGKLVLRVG